MNKTPPEKLMENLFNTPAKKILLIEPPFYNLFGYERWHYPMTLTLVGTYLEEKGHEVKILDADKPLKNCKSLSRTQTRNNYHLYENAIKEDNHPMWAIMREKIKEFAPDILGLTAISAKIDSANKIAEMTKNTYKDKIKIILGGPHAQGMTQFYPNHNFGDYYDNIIPYIPDLVNRKPNKKLLIDCDKYSVKNFSSMLTLTGCPNSCTFCCNSGKNKKIIYRNLESIAEELNEIKNKGGEEIFLVDDCFLSNTRRFNNIGKLMKEEGLTFTASARIMALSPQKIEDFLNYGGRRIQLGIESGSQRILDLVQKKLKVKDITERTKLLNEAGLKWTAFIIAGFPFETIDELKLTEELIYKIKPTFVSLNRFTPYPGTKIWQDYYLNQSINFSDIFQLSPKNNIVKLDENINIYIEKMFDNFDKYNKKNAIKNKSK